MTAQGEQLSDREAPPHFHRPAVSGAGFGWPVDDQLRRRPDEIVRSRPNHLQRLLPILGKGG